MNKKTLYLSFSLPITTVHLYKEPGEIPYYFNKLYNYNSIIDDYMDDNDRIKSFRSVSLHRYKYQGIFKNCLKILSVFTHAHKVDLLYLLQITPDSMLKMLAYRLGGGKGKIYLKLDLGLYEKNGVDLLVWKNMSYLLKVVHTLFKPLPTIYTVETTLAYNRLKNSYYGNLIADNKLYLLPNGFDTDILVENNIQRKGNVDKEKIIITVGRIGSYLKNTELLLDIISNVDLKDWKVYIIGPIEKSFLGKMDDFYAQNPTKKDSVTFTGDITDKKILFEYYNKSRVFMLTSRFESYAFVLTEAAYMNNYVISTDVGAARDLIKTTSGYISDEHKKEPFVLELQRIIDLDDDKLNELIPDTDKKELTWEWILKNNKGIQMLLNE